MKPTSPLKRLIHSNMAFVTAISLYTTTDVCADSSSIAEAVPSSPVEPFSYRAPLDPYQILQLPEFMMQSRAPTDFTIQRSVFTLGAGPWHTHPGPSFVYVLQGGIKLQKFTEQEGCFETPVYGPGQAYFEKGNEVHRAVVVSADDAVLLVVRFNVPRGGPVTLPASDPGCFPTPSLVSRMVPVSESESAVTLDAFIAQQVAPFTFRATLDPYQIHQLPDFMIHSGVPSDFVIQRNIFARGNGGWHIHPGSTFVYVIEGQIKLQKFSEKEGCFETPVYGPGQAYFEVGNEVHRAVVVSEGSAVVLVARLNIPIGSPISISVPNPGCN